MELRMWYHHVGEKYKQGDAVLDWTTRTAIPADMLNRLGTRTYYARSLTKDIVGLQLQEDQC